jgi:hypothetical protein
MTILAISNAKIIFHAVFYLLLRDETCPDLVFISARSGSLNNSRLLIHSFGLQYYLQCGRGILAIGSRGAIAPAFLFGITAVEIIELVASLSKVYY